MHFPGYQFRDNGIRRACLPKVSPLLLPSLTKVLGLLKSGGSDTIMAPYSFALHRSVANNNSLAKARINIRTVSETEVSCLHASEVM